MKRTIAVLCLLALTVSLAAGCSGSAGSGETVSVEAVSSIAAGGNPGLMDRYAGMVVAGDTADVERDSSKIVYETYVEEGDMVQAGDVLFSYDVEKMELDLENLRLEKQREENAIASAQAAITELQTERDKAKDSEKLSYTLQIDTKNAEIRESQYNIGLKDRDIANMEASLGDAEVTAPISGRVMSISEDGGNSGYYDDGSSGTGTKYITITDVTRLRVEGNINELNAGSLTEGMDMLVRSRIDSSVTWSGTLSMIDWDHPVDDSNNNNGTINGTMVYVSGGESDSEMTVSSKYPFYVELTDTEGLMLGQHVYIEPVVAEGSEEPTGPMIPSYYVAFDDDGSPFIWAADSKDKLEKRAVTLGIYDEMQDCYEIKDGLSLSDYIAFPMEGMEEGQGVERYDPSAMMGEDESGMSEAAVAIG